MNCVNKDDVILSIISAFRWYRCNFGIRGNDISMLEENLIESINALPDNNGCKDEE